MENGSPAAPKKSILTALWFYLFAVCATLLLSLIVVGIMHQLADGLLEFDVAKSNAVRAMVDDQFEFMVMLLGVVGISTFGLCVAVPLGVCGAIYLQCYAQRNWARQVLQSAVDTLTRLPAVIIGLFGYYFCVQSGLAWDLLTQSFAFALMLLPTVMNTAGIALEAAGRECGTQASWQELQKKVMTRARPGIFRGIVLALVRVWFELVITLYAVTVALGLLGDAIGANFSELFRLAAAAGTAGDTNIAKVVTLLILVTVVNAFVNWLLKNFALREFWKAKQRGTQG